MTNPHRNAPPTGAQNALNEGLLNQSYGLESVVRTLAIRKFNHLLHWILTRRIDLVGSAELHG